MWDDNESWAVAAFECGESDELRWDCDEKWAVVAINSSEIDQFG